MNLEDLQQEEEEKRIDLTSLKPEDKTTMQQVNLMDNLNWPFKRRLKRLISTDNNLAYDEKRNLKTSPRRNSLLEVEDEKKDKITLMNLIKNKILTFIDEQGIIDV